MKMKKIVATGSALALTAAVAVGGTLAYLQDSTNAVTNKFTYNAASQNVSLEIYEHKINPENPLQVFDTAYTAEDDTHFVYEGDAQDYTIMPGATVEKDPTLRVTSGNTKVYVYAEVKETDESNAIETITMADGWTSLEMKGANNGDVYVLTLSNDGGIATGMAEQIANTNEYPVLKSVKYASTMSADATANIEVYGYVVDAVAGADAKTVYTSTFMAQG